VHVLHVDVLDEVREVSVVPKNEVYVVPKNEVYVVSEHEADVVPKNEVYVVSEHEADVVCELMEGVKAVGDLLKSLSETLACAGARNVNVVQERHEWSNDLIGNWNVSKNHFRNGVLCCLNLYELTDANHFYRDRVLCRGVRHVSHVYLSKVEHVLHHVSRRDVQM
jgi:hypothetical protein